MVEARRVHERHDRHSFVEDKPCIAACVCSLFTSVSKTTECNMLMNNCLPWCNNYLPGWRLARRLADERRGARAVGSISNTCVSYSIICIASEMCLCVVASTHIPPSQRPQRRLCSKGNQEGMPRNSSRRHRARHGGQSRSERRRGTCSGK